MVLGWTQWVALIELRAACRHQGEAEGEDQGKSRKGQSAGLRWSERPTDLRVTHPALHHLIQSDADMHGLR